MSRHYTDTISVVRIPIICIGLRDNSDISRSGYGIYFRFLEDLALNRLASAIGAFMPYAWGDAMMIASVVHADWLNDAETITHFHYYCYN